MKVYITKYALSTGIYIDDVVGTSHRDMVGSTLQQGRYHHGNDYQTDAEFALCRAEEMRIRKIESLKKQISKLEKMDFRKQIEKAEAKAND